MIVKSALRATITEKLEEHEVDNKALADDLLDVLCRDFGEEIYDDEDEDSGPDFFGQGE